MRDNEYSIRPELDAWFRKADEVLKAEDIVLDGLKKAVEEGWLEQQELEERLEAYHRGLSQNTTNTNG